MSVWARLVAERPRLVIVGLLALSIALGAGLGRSVEEPDTLEAFIPRGTELGVALQRLDEHFPESGRTSVVQIVLRGEVLDTGHLAALARTVDTLVADPVVTPVLDHDQPPVTHAALIADLAGVAPDELTPAAVAAAFAAPDDDPRRALLDALVAGPDPAAGRADAAIGGIQLKRGDRPVTAVAAAERRIDEILTGADLGPVQVGTLSESTFEDATDRALVDSQVLFPVAVLAIVAILALVYRAVDDVLITFSGMILTSVWMLGAGGWLGPRGAGVVGGSTPVSIIIPVLLIGLTVDYGLQTTGRYREVVAEGVAPARAAAAAVRSAGAAVALGAVTTAVSFLTSVASPLPPIGDFGILAAIGIAAGFLIMTGWVPALRLLLDRRRGRHSASLYRAGILDNVPGASRVLRGLVRTGTHHPLAVLAATLVVGVGAAVLAVGVDTRFDQSDFLPPDSPFIVDLRFVRETFGGADSTVTAVIVGDVADPDVARHLAGLDLALRDPLSRPSSIVGDPQASLPGLVAELAASDPDVARLADALVSGDRDRVEALLDAVTAAAPDRTRALLDRGPGGDDTTLVVAPIRLDGEGPARDLLDWFDDRFDVDGARLTLTGELILPVVVSDAVTRGQTRATLVTVAAALVILVAYFGLTRRRPVLGLVAVTPVLVVLTLVLTTMRALDIPYNALTATLTALTIGVGVDYAIHLVHRFLHERDAGAPMIIALDRAAATTGGALVASALTTVVGFVVLYFAPLPAVGQLGLLMAVTVAYTFVVSALLLPPFLLLVGDDHSRRRGRPGDGGSDDGSGRA